MSRSQYIWVVEHPWPENADPPHVVAAFTVKHELATWLSDQHFQAEAIDPDNPNRDHEMQIVNGYTVWRLRHSFRGKQERTFVPQSEVFA